MLTADLSKKIESFVQQQPRTVQDIAFALGKNWRTADSYVQRIILERGTLGVKTFREGSRGALKIVYWNAGEKISSTAVQEKLFQQILQGKEKKDFSPFDIYQYLPEEKREAFLLKAEEQNVQTPDIPELLQNAKEQVLFFSGNLSWTNVQYEKNNEKKNEKSRLLNLLEQLAERKISLKILTRVELPGIQNILEVEAINQRIGKELIEIRHAHQPLRGFIIDNTLMRLKEVKNPKEFKQGELDKVSHLFYTFHDQEWVECTQNVFWHIFRTAIPAKKRIADLQSVKER